MLITMQYYRILGVFLLLVVGQSFADTMGNYMKIADNIPKMEVTADPQAQAWARSARNVLYITNEEIAETMTQANILATKENGKPLYCLPAGVTLNALTLKDLIAQTFKTLASQKVGQENLSVSEVAWIAVRQQYPCAGAVKTLEPATIAQENREPTQIEKNHLQEDGMAMQHASAEEALEGKIK
ncbi:MAG: phosphatase [Legionellaceae bacterium]|nr:phosphatase [Legionellaceae bacterium]